MKQLSTEVWISGIQENPVPDTSFLNASVDLSMHVNNDVIHLAEAGVEPGVHKNYFQGNEDGALPIANIKDIPHEVPLDIYSTDQTRHRKLEEVELQYDRRASILKRHKTALEKNIGAFASHAWTPATEDAHNKVIQLTDEKFMGSFFDVVEFYEENDLMTELNVCLSPRHMKMIRKEDLRLYKDILKNGASDLYGFNIYRYSQTPLFAEDGTKKPFGATKAPTDKRCSFMWVTNEVFRAFGSTEMFPTLRSSATQADTISFAQRALVSNIRANAPKYRAAII